MEKKYMVGMFSVLVLAMFVVGLNIGNTRDNGVGDGINYGSNVCVYKNDELIGCQHNTVTTQGLNMVKSALGQGTIQLIANLTVGNTTAPAAGDTALPGAYVNHGLEGTTGTYNSNGNGNWSIAHTWTCSAGPTVVNTTGLCNATNGLFAGTSFTATTLQTDDQIKVNYTIFVT